MSNAWVVDPSRMKLILAMPAGSGVVTVNELPYPIREGADPISGRVPLNRYGGENS